MEGSWKKEPARGQAGIETGSAALRVADELLLASCTIAESSELLGIERRLRQAALRFVQSGSAASRHATEVCLTELARELEADCAYLAVQTSARGMLRSIVSVGSDDAVTTFDGAAALLATLASAGPRGLKVEYPGTDQARVTAAVGAELEARGIRCLRWLAWSEQNASKSETVLVGVHSVRVQRYWTPPRRQIHDGFAELLRSALPWIRSRRPARAPVVR